MSALFLLIEMQGHVMKHSSTLDLGYDETNGPELKLRYNQGFVTDKVN